MVKHILIDQNIYQMLAFFILLAWNWYTDVAVLPLLFLFDDLIEWINKAGLQKSRMGVLYVLMGGTSSGEWGQLTPLKLKNISLLRYIN